MTNGLAAMLVYTTKECNYNSIVIVHQHGGYDVTCNEPRILTIMFENILRTFDVESLKLFMDIKP